VTETAESLGRAMSKLDGACTDFTIYNRDWPRHGFRWEVHAQYFFCTGSGVGKTLEEAVDRAVACLHRRDEAFRRENGVKWDDPDVAALLRTPDETVAYIEDLPVDQATKMVQENMARLRESGAPLPTEEDYRGI
jgi:hypothetical protein